MNNLNTGPLAGSSNSFRSNSQNNEVRDDKVGATDKKIQECEPESYFALLGNKDSLYMSILASLLSPVDLMKVEKSGSSPSLASNADARSKIEDPQCPSWKTIDL